MPWYCAFSLCHGIELYRPCLQYENMTDFKFDNPAFDSDNLDVGDEETMLIDPTEDVGIGADDSTGTTGTRVAQSLQQELLQTTIDDCYNDLAEQGLTPTLGQYTTKFEFFGDGRLRLKAYTQHRSRKLKDGEASFIHNHRWPAWWENSDRRGAGVPRLGST